MTLSTRCFRKWPLSTLQTVNGWWQGGAKEMDGRDAALGGSRFPRPRLGKRPRRQKDSVDGFQKYFREEPARVPASLNSWRWGKGE